MAVRPALALRILCEIAFPSGTACLWDGSGPFIDSDGYVWRGGAVITNIEEIEYALNGEAYTLNIVLSGLKSEVAQLVWEDYEAEEVIGASFKIMTQACDEYDQPIADRETRFTGVIDNLIFHDRVDESLRQVVSDVTAEVTNRFTMRRLLNGAVLSDSDQKARQAVLNPTGTPDRFCERVPQLADKTVVWPRWK